MNTSISIGRTVLPRASRQVVLLLRGGYPASLNPGWKGLQYLSTRRNLHSSACLRNKVDTDGDLCNIHMELPAQEFAIGCSFLHLIALGNLKEVKKMVRSYPDLANFRDYDRRTAIHVAASEGHLEITKFLVENGFQMNRSDRWGGSPLDDAHRHRHLEVFEYLRDQGAQFGSPSQATCFITAASEGDIKEMKEMLTFGTVDVNKGDYDRRTALHLAAGEGRIEIVKFLLDAGADINVRDRWGSRPLDEAFIAGHTAVVDLMRGKGAKAGSGSTAASMGQEALLDLVQTYGKVRGDTLCMDWHDVKNLLKGIGENPTDEIVQKLFDVADLDRNGYIDTEEFLDNHDIFVGERPARIILLVGGPGSGKGVLSERLVKECGVVHLSSGELLREEVAKGTPLGKQVEDIMKSGGLVSSAIMVALMQKRMKDHPGKRILLDGFPRSQENAQDLVAICGHPELALHLDCDDTVLLERIIKRGQSGARSDDNFHTGLQRVRTYHKYHHFLLEFLRQEHIPVVNLDCSATPDGVWEQLRAIGRLMRPSVRLPTESTRKAVGN